MIGWILLGIFLVAVIAFVITVWLNMDDDDDDDSSFDPHSG